MATFYVDDAAGNDGNVGNSGSPWKTLGKARVSAAAGDTVRVRAGTYREQLDITKANMTWMADNPAAKPVVDGGYHIGLMSGGNTITKNSTMPRTDSGSYLPGGTNSKKGMIQLQAAGVTVDGFVVQNSTGSGISINASNTTVRNCVTYFTYSSGIISNPGSNVSGLTVSDNIVRFASVKIFDPERHTNYAGNCNLQCVDGSMKFGRNVGNTLISGNDVAWGFGEGINIGKFNPATAASPIIVEDNVIHDINHTYLYVNASRYVHLRRNLLYCADVELNKWDNDAPVGIRLADEKETYLRDIFVYNNVVVNLGYSMEWGGRHTESTGSYVGHNTFVGGPEAAAKNKPAVMVVKSEPTASYAGGVNQQGIFENNVIDYSMTTPAVLGGNNTPGAGGVTFRNNNWSKSPAGMGNGSGDRVGNPQLVKTNRVLATTGYPTKANTTWASLSAADNLTVGDYQLTSSSPGRGASSNGSTVGGVAPPSATNRDYYDNGRDATPADRDMGAFEYGGTAPPADDIHAAFEYTPTGAGVAPRLISFTDLSTGEGATSLNGWLWEFGDGGTSTAQHPTHSYVNPGQYYPSLTVTDSLLGISDSVTLGPITVTAPPSPTVTADFTVVGARSGNPPLSVEFVDLSGGSVTTWLWEFGDGGTSTSQNPTYVYEEEGLYTVSLTVTNGGSETDTKTEDEYVDVFMPIVRRYIIGPFPARDVETSNAASVTRYDVTDGADTTGIGHLDVATNRPRPAVWLTEQADAPEAVAGELVIWFDEDGTMKAKLPNGTVKTVSWT
jgi:PKD repeat protein